MEYGLRYERKYLKQFAKIPVKAQEQIASKVKLLKYKERWVNVKALVNHKYDYRLRVGNYRVLFDCDEQIKIIAI